MKIDLPATAFETEKKGDIKRLRKEGKIPAVLYGHKEKTKRIYVEHKRFKGILDALKKETVIVNLKVGSKSYPCVIKSLQQNPLNEELMHIDFQHIHRKERVRATVPIHATGKPPGIEKGGILDMHLHEVVVRCLPDDLPSHLDVDVSTLDLGEARHLRDIKTPNLEFELSLDTTVVSILVPRALEAEVKPVIEEEVPVAEEGAVEEGKEEVKEEQAKPGTKPGAKPDKEEGRKEGPKGEKK
jgi:large subunit ribosomal protein L25